MATQLETKKPLLVKAALLWMAIVAQAVAVIAFGVQVGVIIAGVLLCIAIALILHAYFTLAGKIDNAAELNRLEHLKSTRQVQAMLWMFSTIRMRRPLPGMRDYAISPDFGNTLISLVMEKRPRNILEFGSGTSTLLSAYCLEMNGSGKLYSVDHDEKFLEQTRRTVRDHRLEQYVELIHADLREMQCNKGKFRWYNPSFVERMPEIDLLVVDGPPQWIGDLARYPALPVMLDKLSDNAVILIDDSARKDETEMVARWIEQFPGFDRIDLPHEKGAVILRRRAATVERDKQMAYSR